MTKRAIWGTSIATIFVIITIVTIPLSYGGGPPAYGLVTDGTVTSNPADTVYKFTVATMGSIPHNPDTYIIISAGLVAYGWLDGLGTSAVLVAIHPGLDDSNQNPNNWHPHTATISGGCVTSLSSPQGGVSITGSTLTLTLKATSATVTPDTFAGPPAAFTLAGPCIVPLP